MRTTNTPATARSASSRKLPMPSGSPKCDNSAASPRPAAMPAIGPSHLDIPDAAGAAGTAGLAGSAAPGCAGITGCAAGPVVAAGGRGASLPLHADAAAAAQPLGGGEVTDGEGCRGQCDDHHDSELLHAIPPVRILPRGVARQAVNTCGRDAAPQPLPSGCALRPDRTLLVPSWPSAPPGPGASGSTRRDNGSSRRRRRPACPAAAGR